MIIESTSIEGLKIVKPKVFKDERGYFFESYNLNAFSKFGINCQFVQDNQSYSKWGVLRGLHFQKGEYAQSKLVRVMSGEILDVVVDLRPESSTYLENYSIKLSSENKLQLFVPKGFAHGFVTLSENAVVMYKCDNFYHPDAEDGLMYDDPKLNIDWMVAKENLIVNQKDLQYKYL